MFVNKIFMKNRVGVNNIFENLFEINIVLGFFKYVELESLGYFVNVVIVLVFVWVF